MARDSLFGERIVWQGRCRAVSVPFAQKAMAAVAAVVSAVTLCYAVVVAKALDVPVGGMVLFAAWCAHHRARRLALSPLVAVASSSTSSPTGTSSGVAAASAGRSTSAKSATRSSAGAPNDASTGRPRPRSRGADGRAASNALAHAARRRGARSPVGHHPRRRAERAARQRRSAARAAARRGRARPLVGGAPGVDLDDASAR